MSNPLTLQEAFDEIWTRFVIGNAPRSVGPDPSGEFYTLICRYRGDDGSACFIGALIPDERYSLIMEGCSSDVVYAKGIFDHNAFPAQAARELQNIHDRNFNEREARLRNFARRYNLTIPVERVDVEALEPGEVPA